MMGGLKAEFSKQLKNFPLQIEFTAEGGCIGILGASGCGKSMTLKVIAGIEIPDTGNIQSGEECCLTVKIRSIFRQENAGSDICFRAMPCSQI